MRLTSSILFAAISRRGHLGGWFCEKRDADAPTLPADGPWSSEFREFLSLCLEKNPARRFGCSALMETAFIQRAVGTWQPGTRRFVLTENEERRLSYMRLVPLYPRGDISSFVSRAFFADTVAGRLPRVHGAVRGGSIGNNNAPS